MNTYRCIKSLTLSLSHTLPPSLSLSPSLPSSLSISLSLPLSHSLSYSLYLSLPLSVWIFTWNFDIHLKIINVLQYVERRFVYPENFSSSNGEVTSQMRSIMTDWFIQVQVHAVFIQTWFSNAWWYGQINACTYFIAVFLSSAKEYRKWL